MGWVEITALERHWDKAEVDAEVTADRQVRIQTRNVAGLRLHLDDAPRTVTLDDHPAAKPAGRPAPGQPLVAIKQNGQWRLGYAPEKPAGLVKRPNLQGPIDDAFMDSFLMVRPTGQPFNPAVGQWVQAELAEAVFQWRRQLRGQARIKDDRDLTEADLKNHNLVLWGDPASNRALARLADQLPIRWTAKGIVVQGKTHDPSQHALALVYPNPLNPERYVVLNSGPTFLQGSGSSNARQTPKLPDWAVLELAVPITERLGGKGVAAAGFFGEQWELRAEH
jgi:hypothetical protein